jgi:hypothetical protein
MNEKSKSTLPLLFAMLSLVISATLFTLSLLYFAEGNGDLANFLLLAGWIPGLVLTIISLAMLNRLRSWLEKAATVFLCFSTMLAVLVWAFLIYIHSPRK